MNTNTLDYLCLIALAAPLPHTPKNNDIIHTIVKIYGVIYFLKSGHNGLIIERRAASSRPDRGVLAQVLFVQVAVSGETVAGDGEVA